MAASLASVLVAVAVVGSASEDPVAAARWRNTTTTVRSTTTIAPTTTVAPPTTPPPTTTAAPTTTVAPTTTIAPTTTVRATTTVVPTTSVASVAAVKCAVFLHGKSGYGSNSWRSGDVTMVYPQGNAVSSWGGYEWRYFPESGYQAVRASIASAISANKCTRVILDGFSNGAAAAAKGWCRGETFGGTLVGVIVDDPVTDHGIDTCARAAGIKAKLYWTGAIEMGAGWQCSWGDWTCEGGETIGIARYSGLLGLPATPSIYTWHQGYDTAPELTSWW